MARFLSAIRGVFLLAISTSLLLVNAEEEKILSDKDLEIKNDEPALEDQELLNDLLAEAQNGKSLNWPEVQILSSCVVFCLRFLLKILFCRYFDFIKETGKKCYIKLTG